jgi:type II secretory pathway predicted ATPase ExeA
VTIDRLKAHYGFSRQPFGRSLAPGQLFTGRGHQEAVARLRWLIDETAIGVLTGEVGAGKTVAARATVAALDASRHTIVYLANPMVGARGIHHHLVTALGAVPRFHRPALIAQTAELLAAEHDERRKTVVLIVDEAHLLSVEQLEQLRLLTNTDMDARSPLTLILLGQPTLKRRLKQGHFAALDQRIGLRYHLDGLPLEPHWF